MQLKSLFPWSGHGREDRAHPLSPLRDEIDRLFESFPTFGTSLRDMEGRARVFSPSIDITENDKRIKVKADLPGMEEKDIDLVLSENTLVIKGEKTRSMRTRTMKNMSWKECMVPFKGAFSFPRASIAKRSTRIFTRAC